MHELCLICRAKTSSKKRYPFISILRPGSDCQCRLLVLNKGRVTVKQLRASYGMGSGKMEDELVEEGRTMFIYTMLARREGFWRYCRRGRRELVVSYVNGQMVLQKNRRISSP